MYRTTRATSATSIVLAALIGMVGCVQDIKAEGSPVVSREEAIEIANRTIVKLGYDLNELLMVVDEGNQEWNRYAAGMKHSHLGPEVLKDFEQKEAKLRGHSFWHIAYKFRPHEKTERLGGAAVFVDATNGQVLLVNSGH